MAVDNPLNMGPSAKLGEKPVPNFKRPPKPEKAPVTVWDADGNPHTVARGNLNDALARPGWSAKPPSDAVVDADDQADEAENTDPDQGVSPDATELDEAMTALQALRDEAEALGVKTDARWGKKRLAAEIEAAKAASNPE